MGASRTIVAIVCMSLGAHSGGPAAAQSMMDREGPPPRTQPTATSNRADVLRAAACVTASGPALASAILSSTPGSLEERRAAIAFLRAGQRCLHLARPIETTPGVARGAAAESLYEARFTTPPPARTPALVPASLPHPADALAYAYSLADCTAAARQDLVRALLASDPATPAEASAVQALGPVFESCTARGVRMALRAAELRGLLAEALYRWSVVQRDGAAAPFAASQSH